MSTRRSSIRYAAVVAALLVLGARSAAAGPSSPDDGCLTDSSCLGHYNQAVKLFEDRRFEPALGEFQAAYHRRQMPWLLINIGRTLHRLGRPREALEYYERHRLAETKPDAETLERREKYTAQARALIEASANPSAAATSEPGETAAAAQTAAATEPAATAPTSVVAPTAAAATAAATVNASEQPEKPPLYKKWWFWTAIGGGVAVIAIVGIAAGVASTSHSGLPSGVTAITYKF